MVKCIRLRGIFIALICVGAYAIISVEAGAQATPLPLVPGNLSPKLRDSLARVRADLDTRLLAYRSKQSAYDSHCSGVIPSDAYATIDACKIEYAAVLPEATALQKDKSTFVTFIAKLEQKLANCDAVGRQAEKDREQIDRQRRANETSQEELAEWSALNEESQKKAVEAAVKFMLGEYVANIGTVQNSVSKLRRQADFLAKKADKSRKHATRMKYFSRFDATLTELQPELGVLMAKTIVKKGLDAEKAWSISRATMQHEFRVASKRNQAMREILKDPGFKEAFTGDDIDTPGLDVLAALTKQAGEELGKFEIGLKKYEKATGPAVRAAGFVRDAAYSALLSGLSTQRVLQQNDLAGEAAKAARALQLQYQRTIDAQRACRADG